MKNKYALLVCPLIFLVSLASVQAIAHIEISVKPVFYLGENVGFNYTLISDNNEVIRYSASVNCPNAIQSLIELKAIQLIANQKVYRNYSYLTVDETVGPQTCSASVSIQDPYRLTVTKQLVIATNPSFSLDVYTCKIQDCSERSKVFTKDEDVYLSYSSDVSGLSIDAKLTYPDTTIRQITLPATIKAEQIGTYELDATASKQGYRSVIRNEQFGVIAQPANISYQGNTNANDNSSLSANNNAAPQETTPENNPNPSLSWDENSIYVLGIIVIASILVIVVLIALGYIHFD